MSISPRLESSACWNRRTGGHVQYMAADLQISGHELNGRYTAKVIHVRDGERIAHAFLVAEPS